ncbi:MAG: HAD family hydrolase [Rubrivivax sp.]
MVPAPVDLVVFDCDGVLVDSERLSHQVLQQMLAEQGVAMGFDDLVQRFIGSSVAATLQRVAALLGREQPPAGFFDDFVQRSQRAFRAGLTTVPGVEAVLDALQPPWCVASNGNRAKVEFTLGHTGLRARAGERIFTADDVQHPKPAPDLFLHAAARLGARPAHTLVVEDTPTGVRAARAAGMTAIGFAAMTPAATLREAGAHDVVASMAELGALLPLHPHAGPGLRR